MKHCVILLLLAQWSLLCIAQVERFGKVTELKPIDCYSFWITPPDTSWLVQLEKYAGDQVEVHFHMVHGLGPDSLGRTEALITGQVWQEKKDVQTVDQLKALMLPGLQQGPDSSIVVSDLVMEADPRFNADKGIRCYRQIHFRAVDGRLMVRQEVHHVFVQPDFEAKPGRATGRKWLVLLTDLMYDCVDPVDAPRDVMATSEAVFKGVALKPRK